MKVEKLKIACASDIHFFHPKTLTRDIVDELKNKFNSQKTDLDILFLAGDVFDRISTLPKEQVALALDFINYILRWAKETDTQIRILEGTPSHDWKQSEWFIKINELANIQADCKYFKNLEIEYNSRYGIYVLYVPDEWEADTADTLKQVKDLMKAKNLDKIDLAIMHGQFHYQLPEIARAPKHDESEYLSLVKYFIFIGHVHKHSFYERIIAQGSFSRLCHGEEEPKGYVEAILNKNGEMSWEFIENELATKYISVDVTGEKLDRAYSLIDEKISNLEEGSNVRVIAENTHPIIRDLDSLIRKYPLLKWASKIIDLDKKKDTEKEESLLTERTGVIQLTRENIVAKLLERLAAKETPASVLEKAESVLVGVIKESES